MSALPFRLALLLALALNCKGFGCTPGDFTATCAQSCGESGVALVLTQQNVCVCRSAVTPRAEVAR
jgi:hypothetical protein